MYLIGGIHHTRLRQVSYPGVTGANRTSGDRMCLPLVSLAEVMSPEVKVSSAVCCLAHDEEWGAGVRSCMWVDPRSGPLNMSKGAGLIRWNPEP